MPKKDKSIKPESENLEAVHSDDEKEEITQEAWDKMDKLMDKILKVDKKKEKPTKDAG